MKFISPKIHGFIDYLVVIFLLCSPAYFGFTGLLAIFTYLLGAVHLLLTISTNYPSGLFKIISFQAHGKIELLVGIVLIVLAYTLFAHTPGNEGELFYVVFGTVVLLTWLVTNYKGVSNKSVTS